MCTHKLRAAIGAATILRTVALAAVCVLGAARAGATTMTLDLDGLAAGSFASPLFVDGFELVPFLGGSGTPTIETIDGITMPGNTGDVFAGGADTNLTMLLNDGDNDVISAITIAFAVRVPEPASFALLAAGLAGLTLLHRRRIA